VPHQSLLHIPYAGHIPHPAQQTVGNPRRAPTAAGDFSAGLGREAKTEQTRRPLHNRLQILLAIKLEPLNQAEAIAQR